MASTITIKMLPEDIEGAQRGNIHKCPVARAITRTMGHSAWTDGDDWGFSDMISAWPLSARVSKWISDYDASDLYEDYEAGSVVEPINFRLTVPEGGT